MILKHLYDLQEHDAFIYDGCLFVFDCVSFAHNGKLINCTFRDCVNEVAGGAIGFLCENGAIINCIDWYR